MDPEQAVAYGLIDEIVGAPGESDESDGASDEKSE
jgi:ATP-dependent protease ClpP protease subunit